MSAPINIELPFSLLVANVIGGEIQEAVGTYDDEVPLVILEPANPIVAMPGKVYNFRLLKRKIPKESGGGDDELEDLKARVRTLEQKVAQLEGNN